MSAVQLTMTAAQRVQVERTVRSWHQEFVVYPYTFLAYLRQIISPSLCDSDDLTRYGYRLTRDRSLRKYSSMVYSMVYSFICLANIRPVAANERIERERYRWECLRFLDSRDTLAVFWLAMIFRHYLSKKNWINYANTLVFFFVTKLTKLHPKFQ